MVTFSTNRIYSVGRMVKVAERMRSGFVPRGFDSIRISNAKFITISAERRVCVGAFTCPCSPGVEAWHGDPYSGIRPTPGQGPAWTGSRFKDSGPAWRDRRCDYAVTPQKEMLPRVHRLADSRTLGDWICDEFCIWDTEGIEPTRDKPRSHMVYDLNHSVNRV